MKKTLWIIVASVAALIALSIIVLCVFNPFSQTSPTEQNNFDALFIEYIDIDDINEYQNYIEAEKNLPEDFVTAEKLSIFGSFEDFQIAPHELFVYAYDFLTENDNHIDLYITHVLSDNPPRTYDQLPVSAAGSSMLTLAEKERGAIIRNGVEYRYNMGQLTSVRWTVDDIQFRIEVDPSWSDYSTLPTDSLLYRMLSVSETEFASALTEMNAITSLKEGAVMKRNLWLIGISTILLVALCLLGLVLKKRLKTGADSLY